MALYISAILLLAAFLLSVQGAEAYYSLPMKRMWNPAKAHRLGVPPSVVTRYIKQGYQKGVWGVSGTVDGAKAPVYSYQYGVQYYVPIEIGTPGQHFNVLFDTATSDTWVAAAGCSNDVCADANRFFTNESSTFQASESTINATNLGLLTVQGTSAKDTINVAGISVPDQSFLLVSKEGATTGPFGSFGHWDGALGLGLLKDQAAPSGGWFLNAVHNDSSLNPCFSVYFDPLSSAGGVLTIGGYDEQSYVERLVDIPTVPNTNWGVYLKDVIVDFNDVYNVTVSQDSPSSRLTALPSSLSPFITGPTAPVEYIMTRIYATQTEWHTFQVACENRSSLPSIVFRLGDNDADETTIEYVLHGEDYVFHDQTQCLVGITTNADDTSNAWTLGEPFLRRVFTVFDLNDASNPKLRLAYARGGPKFAPSLSASLAMGLMSAFVLAVTAFAGF